MMPEAEAKTKWCPFARVGEQASGAAENRPDGSYNCIASACMAWRTGGTVRFDDEGKRVFGGAEMKFKERLEIGCCGLAGRDD